jgi:DNA-directed RNA polymerase subunit beta
VKLIVEAGKKLTARTVKQLGEKGVKALRATNEDLHRHVSGRRRRQHGNRRRSISKPVTTKIDEERRPMEVLLESGHDNFKILDIDHVNVGGYIRNTLVVDKNESRQEALFDIYRVMRPGEPPTMETAEAMFQSLFFDSERYDLSAVGRVKMNMRLDLDVEDTVRVAAQGGHRRGSAHAARPA